MKSEACSGFLSQDPVGFHDLTGNNGFYVYVIFLENRGQQRIGGLIARVLKIRPNSDHI